MEYVEKPAVLADILWKNAPSHVTDSVIFINAVPTAVNARLTEYSLPMSI